LLGECGHHANAHYSQIQWMISHIGYPKRKRSQKKEDLPQGSQDIKGGGLVTLTIRTNLVWLRERGRRRTRVVSPQRVRGPKEQGVTSEKGAIGRGS